MRCLGTQPIHDGLRRVQRFLRGLERGDVSSALSRRNGDGGGGCGLARGRNGFRTTLVADDGGYKRDDDESGRDRDAWSVRRIRSDAAPTVPPPP